MHARYVSWRIQSLQWALRHRNYRRLALIILPSYIWLGSLPLAVSVGSAQQCYAAAA